MNKKKKIDFDRSILNWVEKESKEKENSNTLNPEN